MIELRSTNDVDKGLGELCYITIKQIIQIITS